MALPALRITVDGLPATEIAAHTPPVFETWADGGCGSLTWQFDMSPKRTHHLLYPGALAQLWIGMHPLFSGRLSDPDRSDWSIRAYGHATHARNLTALTSGGVVTRDVAVAANTARTAWGWIGADPTGVMTGTAAGNSTGPQSLGSLFDQRAQEIGRRWGVDARGRIFFRNDPSTPSLYLSPDVAALGQTDEGAPSHMAARYLDSTSGLNAFAFWPIGTTVTKIENVDLTVRGALSITQANAILGGELALRPKRAAWTSGMTVHRPQLQFNGVEPFLPTITAGETMVQLVGVPAAFAAGAVQHFVLGKTRWDAAAPDQIYLEPAGAAPRGAIDVWAAA